MISNKATRILLGLLISAAVVTSTTWAAKKTEPPPETPLTDKGKKLLTKYTSMLEEAPAEIKKALPEIDENKKAEFLKLYTAESEARSAELKAIRAQDRKPAGHPSKAVYEKAKKALGLAVTNALEPSEEMLKQLNKLLESDKLDTQLARCEILTHATPRGLAEYSQQGKDQEKLIDELLSNSDLMMQMAVAGGANEGKYGRAMEIYTAIQKTSDKAKQGVFQRLALGIALEHAVPVKQSNPAAQPDAPKTVDPVKRYLHYEKAYFDGELDPGFKDLSVWDYRLVANGNEPDNILTWGRRMLHNYRPDHISTSDYRWRYVKTVKTDVKYGSADNKYDKPELQSYQNILMNGGVCGRRAFFGRFILRAFGIPTTARPQHGHATLTHWTPAGWVICLGASWTWGWTSFGQDLDFLAHTQARMTGEPFLQVRRAQMIGTALGEPDTFGFYDKSSGFWNGVALYKQRQIIEEAKAVALAAVGTDIGEANESKEKDVIEDAGLTDDDKKVVIARDGTITIPAVACSFPTNSPGKILFMDSNLGGKQMHYSRNGKPIDFEYTFEAPKAGKYKLSARVVTPSWKQHLLLTVNNATEPIDIEAPFTVGEWDKTEPVEIKLVKGKNVLHFSRNHEKVKGMTIKDFTLTPEG